MRDTGIGIPGAELPRVFERFHRVEGARARTHEGSGIGLALVHELVQLHGGTIDGRQRAAAAARRFTVAIPRGTRAPAAGSARRGRVGCRPRHGAPRVRRGGAALAADDATPTSSAARVGPTANVRGTILLADDNADMRDYVARLLGERLDASRRSADGAEALDARSARRRPTWC